MRSWTLLGLASLLGGCGVLDQLSLNGAQRLDPNKIYLGRSAVLLDARDLTDYACTSGPLVCTQRGGSFDCHCPNGL